MLTHKAVTSEDLPGRGRLRMVDARTWHATRGRAVEAIAARE
jgi:hypothetical protein